MSAKTVMKRSLLGAVRPPLVIAAVVWLVSGSAAAAGGSVAVSVKSLHKSGVSAEATFTSQDDATIVTLAVTGGKGALLLPDIRSGTCAHAAATPEIPLAMTSSASQTETMIDVPLSELSDGSFVLMLHRMDGDLASLAPKTALACGAIGAKPALTPIANSAPAAGVGPVGSGRDVQWPVVALAGLSGGAAAVGWRLRKRSEAL